MSPTTGSLAMRVDCTRRIVWKPIREKPLRSERPRRGCWPAPSATRSPVMVRAELERRRRERRRQHQGVERCRRRQRWSRYNGFDFDGDGVGESAHSLLRPFEQIEARTSSRVCTFKVRRLVRSIWLLAACRTRSVRPATLTRLAAYSRGTPDAMARGRALLLFPLWEPRACARRVTA